MKNALKKLMPILHLIIIIALCSGCGLAVLVSNNSQHPGNQAKQDFAATISKEQEAEINKLLSDYFSTLYSALTVEEYAEKTVKGIIPDEIREFISLKTITEGDGNPEVGIHLPRFVSLNGETIIAYEIPEKADAGYINSSFIAKSGDIITFFCKVKTKATVVPDNVFLECYMHDYSYKKQKDIDPEYMDKICAELKYDVELTEENGKLKILRAIETNIKPGVKNRLFLLNNENITRLPYLDISQKADGSGYNNPADGEVYEKEKAVISDLFKNLANLDRERMNLLSYKWEQGYYEVRDYLDGLGITKNKDGNADIIILSEDYKQELPFESLPLRYNMEKIKKIDNIKLSLHPAYSEKRKLYFVNFDATVQRINGITDEYFKYRYDYLVVLDQNDEQLLIDNIKLNEYYVLP
jgi:hypothetical protein